MEWLGFFLPFHTAVSTHTAASGFEPASVSRVSPEWDLWRAQCRLRYIVPAPLRHRSWSPLILRSWHAYHEKSHLEHLCKIQYKESFISTVKVNDNFQGYCCTHIPQYVWRAVQKLLKMASYALGRFNPWSNSKKNNFRFIWAVLEIKLSFWLIIFTWLETDNVKARIPA